jgi:tRNA U34 5-carboxymethylaminomethyl modifying GTPase MnmE/TrmE
MPRDRRQTIPAISTLPTTSAITTIPMSGKMAHTNPIITDILLTSFSNDIIPRGA